MVNSTSCFQILNLGQCTISKIFVLILVFFTVACTPKNPNTEKINQQSYALGIQAGRAFKKQGFEIDQKQYADGFAEGFNGTEESSDIEIQEIVTAAQTERQQMVNIQFQERELAGKEYLEKNATRPGVKVINTGIQYEVLLEGKGPTPRQQDHVAIYLKGALTDGKVFEDDFATKKSRKVSVIELDQGLRRGVQAMKAGSRYRFFLAPEFAFGLRGTKDVPPQSVVIYDLELAQVIRAK